MSLQQQELDTRLGLLFAAAEPRGRFSDEELAEALTLLESAMHTGTYLSSPSFTRICHLMAVRSWQDADTA